MFLNNASNILRDKYLERLGIIGGFSRLFSDSTAPYLPYRTVEILFCDVFGARNHTRADTSVDAVIENLGFGIKTFTATGSSKSEKIAEFDRKGQELRTLHNEPNKLAQTIAGYRNERIDFARNLYEISNNVFHLVVRRENEILILEQPMDYINIRNIKIISNRSTLKFSDSRHEYTYNYAKSTLFQTFMLNNLLYTIKVNILENPFDLLDSLRKKGDDMTKRESKPDLPYIILALYSELKGIKYVPEKSGLNQWNAKGRLRGPREVYIPIRREIHKRYPGFFPNRKTPFELLLPSGRILSAKVCEQSDKALMSNPNKDLGEWLLDEVLNQPKDKLVTYEQLEELGIDSVMITKLDTSKYSIDFKKLGSYEEFMDSPSSIEAD